MELIPLAKQRLWTAFLSIYLKKKSCFEPSFSAAIDRFAKHGLIVKWVRDFTATTYKKDDKIPQPLTLQQIQGIFLICMGFYIIAIIIFILEIVINYRKNHEAMRVPV